MTPTRPYDRGESIAREIRDTLNELGFTDRLRDVALTEPGREWLIKRAQGRDKDDRERKKS